LHNFLLKQNKIEDLQEPVKETSLYGEFFLSFQFVLAKLCFATAVLGYEFKCMSLQFGENALPYRLKDIYLILNFLQWQLLYGFNQQGL